MFSKEKQRYKMNKDLILNFQSPLDSISLTFEDNGNVAYAYIKKDNKCVGDVWLYNHYPIEKAEWSDIQNAPFLNPMEYISEKGILNQNVNMEDILVTWEEDGNEVVAYIYLFEDLCGVVGIGDKPGYARFSIKNSPIAKIMNIE